MDQTRCRARCRAIRLERKRSGGFFSPRLTPICSPSSQRSRCFDFNSGDVTRGPWHKPTWFEALKKAGVRTIVIGSPVCVDSFNYQNESGERLPPENQRLAVLAGIGQGCRGQGRRRVRRRLWRHHFPPCKRKRPWRGESFPFRSGWRRGFNMAVASAFSQGTRLRRPIGTITFDYAAGTAVGTPGQEIRLGSRTGPIAIESTAPPFWFPGHNIAQTASATNPPAGLIPFNQDLDRYMLIVKNLPKGQTKVYLDDQNPRLLFPRNWPGASI